MISLGNLAFLVGVLILLTSTTGSSVVPASRRVWCYYTNWAQYRPGNMKYAVEDTAPHLCTHFSFAFAVIKNNRISPFEKNDDDYSGNEGMYTKFNKLRLMNPRLKTFLAVGGWNFASEEFSEMSQSPASRRTFIDSAVNMLRRKQFDGLDVDWEYPAHRGGNADDKKHFSLLIKELHEAFVEESIRTNKPRLILAIAVGAAKKVIDSAYDVTAISRFADFINIMSYDFHGSWENTTAHPSPLFANKDDNGNERFWNTAWSAFYWVKEGTPQNKINVGIPLYGRSFTLSNPEENGIGASTFKPGKMGPITRSKGFLGYFEACNMLKDGAKRVSIEDQKIPYLVLGNQWLGYEDRESVVAKVEWLIRNHFSGVMVWAIDLDDYKGWCGQGKYPLMNAINTALRVEEPRTEPEVSVTTPSVNPETTSNVDNSPCKYWMFGVFKSQVSCRHFVLCLNGDSFLNQCPRKMEWNSLARHCVSQGYGDCAKTSN